MGNLGAQISFESANFLIPDREELHKACIRAGYFMPPFKDDINTATFLMGVKDQEVWCLAQN